MKKMVRVLVVLLFLLLCGLCLITNPLLPEPANVSSEIPLPDTARLHRHVLVLCAQRPARQSDNPASLDSAAAYIQKTLQGSGIACTEQKYLAEGRTYKNVLCSFGPAAGEHIVVGAHYDVCGEQAGADDNASSVAGLLELAGYLQTHSATLPLPVDLVFYTLEEPPHFRTAEMGSAVHARYLKENNIPVKYMICLETIGYYSDEKGSQSYPLGILKLFYPTTGNFITVVGKIGQGGTVRKIKRALVAASGMDVRSINAPAFVPGIDFSDHLNYWAAGYPAVMITNTAFYRNKNYHETTDLPATLDYHKMACVIRGLCYAVGPQK